MFLKGILNATFTFTVKLPEAAPSFSFTRSVSPQSEEQRERFSGNVQTRSTKEERQREIICMYRTGSECLQN